MKIDKKIFFRTYILVVDETAYTLYRAVDITVAEVLPRAGVPDPELIVLLRQHVRCVTLWDRRT